MENEGKIFTQDQLIVIKKAITISLGRDSSKRILSLLVDELDNWQHPVLMSVKNSVFKDFEGSSFLKNAAEDMTKSIDPQEMSVINLVLIATGSNLRFFCSKGIYALSGGGKLSFEKEGKGYIFAFVDKDKPWTSKAKFLDVYLEEQTIRGMLLNNKIG
jgi:hypothetical protein